MQRRPWYERLMDRDNPAGPFIVLALLILAIGMVLIIGPILDRLISGDRPSSDVRQPPALVLTWPGEPPDYAA